MGIQRLWLLNFFRVKKSSMLLAKHAAINPFLNIGTPENEADKTFAMNGRRDSELLQQPRNTDGTTSTQPPWIQKNSNLINCRMLW